MLDPGLTYVTVMTPRGIGAIASCLVLGPAAFQAVNDCFSPRRKKPLTTTDQGRILFGRWLGGEELLVCVRDENSIEVHSHGGRVAVSGILKSLADAGCQQCDDEQLLDFLVADPLVRLASRLLPTALTSRTAGLLLEQYRGGLSAPLGRIVENLEAGELAAARRALEQLLRFADLGRHLAKPWRVCLAGAANAGKSSLLNALLGYQRAIVHEQAGTTRDRLTAFTAVDGWPLELVDTAGMRESNEPLEQAGMELARLSMESADIVLLVIDASQPAAGQSVLPGGIKDPLLVLNKWDLVDATAVAGSDLAEPPDPLPGRDGIRISATEKWGLQRLLDDLIRRLVIAPDDPGQPVPCGDELIDAVSQAASAVDRGEVEDALRLLSSWHARD